MVDINANLLSVMNDNDFLVILPDDIKYPLYACGASGLWTETVYPKLPGYLEIARYYFRYWTKERLFPDPEYSVMIFRGTVDPCYNEQKSSERAVWLVNDTVVKLLEDRYGTINTLFHNENIYDLRNSIPTVGYHVVGRHNGKTEDLKKMLNSMYGTDSLGFKNPYIVHTSDAIVEELKEQVLAEFKVSPFPPYKYDSAAYQKIVASREAMKRAENGESEEEAIVNRILNNALKLTMSIPKVGDVELKFDKVVPYDDHVADALRYCVNDVLATNELYEN